MKILKRTIVCLILAATMLGLCACEEKPGMTDQEAEAVLAPLLDQSMEMMHVIYGEGLRAEKTELDENQPDAQYENVLAGQGYASISDLKDAMGEVFSADYRVEIFTLMFDGYNEAEDENEEDKVTLETKILPRYRESGGRLQVDIRYRSLPITITPSAKGAKVIEGNATRVKVEIPYTDKDGGSGTMRVTLAKDNDVWLIDGPTY